MPDSSATGSLSIGQLATLACLLEVSIPKPGNVHRSADFADTTFNDFLISAVAIAPAMESASSRSLGETVLQAVEDTRRLVSTNTNLGMVLLLAPLAAVADINSTSLAGYLATSDDCDAAKIYQAIALCQPGGLGSCDAWDAGRSEHPRQILEAMRLAEHRDMIAAQYGNGFADVLEFILPAIQQARADGCTLIEAVIHAHLQTMQRYPDSLIARKNGSEVARQSAAMAGDVLSSGKPFDADYLASLADLDFWLRADGNRRNPGTTADLIAAALFAGLRLNLIDPR